MSLVYVRQRSPFGYTWLSFKIGRVTYSSPWAFICHRAYDLRWSLNRHFAGMNAALGGCERCGSFWRAAWRGAHTAYIWDGKGEDPNRAQWLCEPCSVEHDEYWQGMWEEYYASRGC